MAGETQGLADKQDAETEKRLRGQMADWTRKENEKVEKLRQKLGEIKSGDPESALGEEIARARESTHQLKRLLAERDLAEAKDEADRAAASLDRATEHLEEGAPGRRKQAEARAEMSEDVAEARALAEEISNDARQMLPKPEDTLSPEERRARARRPTAKARSAIAPRKPDATPPGVWESCPGSNTPKKNCVAPPSRCDRRRAICARAKPSGPVAPKRTRPNVWPSCATRCRSDPSVAERTSAIPCASRAPTSRPPRAPGARNCWTP